MVFKCTYILYISAIEIGSSTDVDECVLIYTDVYVLLCDNVYDMYWSGMISPKSMESGQTLNRNWNEESDLSIGIAVKLDRK